MHKRTYIIIEGYEWDFKKAHTNLKKHGIDFADAIFVLEDEHALTIRETYSNEVRMITIGEDSLGRILVVVSTLRGKRIRIISARKATIKEIIQYEK
ncbi:BrnT family toxin [Acidobacteriota bacterium]